MNTQDRNAARLHGGLRGAGVQAGGLCDSSGCGGLWGWRRVSDGLAVCSDCRFLPVT